MTSPLAPLPIKRQGPFGGGVGIFGDGMSSTSKTGETVLPDYSPEPQSMHGMRVTPIFPRRAFRRRDDPGLGGLGRAVVVLSPCIPRSRTMHLLHLTIACRPSSAQPLVDSLIR